MTALITGKNISLCYKSSIVLSLEQVSFSIPKGQTTLFLGKSGSGKTSLLRCIAHLVTHYTGDILFEDRLIKKMTRKERAKAIGYVAQNFNLFPHLTVLENCTQPQRLVLGRSKQEAKQKANDLLTVLDIAMLANRKPSELSGGQAQRVAIARALCMDAKALLMDEPTSALDPESTQTLAEVIKSLNKQGVSIAISTHDMSFARKIFEHGYFIESGKIIEDSDSKLKNFLNH